MCTVTSPVFSNMIVASSGPPPEQASIYVDKPMPLSFPFCSDFFLLSLKLSQFAFLAAISILFIKSPES